MGSVAALVKRITVAIGLLAGGSAWAGYYKVTYAGTGEGTATWVDGTSMSWPVSGGGTTPMGVAGGDTHPGVAGTADLTVTATFRWVEDTTDDPPPKAVVVRQTSYAWYSGLSGSCDDGLDGTSVSGDFWGESNGLKHEIVNDPGESFTRTCTLSATAATWRTPDHIEAMCGVQYSAAAHPLYLDLSGTRVFNGIENAIVGQRIGASIRAIGMQYSTGNHSWTITGDKFKNWLQEYLDGSPQPERGFVEWLSAADLASASPTWISKGAESTRTVSCTATVYDWDVPIGTVSLSTSYYCYEPLQWKTIQHVSSGGNAVDQNGSTGWVDSRGPGTIGIAFEVGFRDPVGFGDVDGHQWLVQLCQLWRTSSPNTVTFDEFMLDNFFPYESEVPTPALQSLSVSTDDTPGHRFYSSGIVRDHYQMYAMYRPPGYGSQYVTRASVTWQWDADVDCYRSGLFAYFTVSGPGPMGTNNSTDYAMPEWEHRFVN